MNRRVAVIGVDVQPESSRLTESGSNVRLNPTAFTVRGEHDSYSLIGRFSTGAYGEIQLARSRNGRGHLVAIKRARLELGFGLGRDEDMALAIEREAWLLSQMRHPNVVRLLDTCRVDGTAQIVLEFIHGNSVAGLFAAARHRRHPIPPRVAIAIARATLDALDLLNRIPNGSAEAGWSHCDISPDNVLAGADGEIRLADLGVAAPLGSIWGFGKIGYMAPERLSDARLAPHMDLYSVGVVLWELLTGQRLFAGADEPSLWYRVASESAPRVASLAPWVSGPLDALVKRATDRRPEARFASARDMHRALVAVPEGVGSACEVAAAVRRSWMSYGESPDSDPTIPNGPRPTHSAARRLLARLRGWARRPR